MELPNKRERQPRPHEEGETVLPSYREKIDWGEVYRSDLLIRLKQKRMRFVVPAVVLVTLAFAALWTIQNYVPELANAQVIGYVNVAFLFTMLLFPLIWCAGLAYTRYATKVLEPIEQDINDHYGAKEDTNE